MKRTRLSICTKKARFATERDAHELAARAAVPLRVYRCDRCRRFHLTSRTKGKRIPRTQSIDAAT
ncbi:MAG: hypothetical protein LKF30_08885 [Sphingobium sp.]|nr:hypothetical protein [Sphingobium sp.]MCI1270453.1 hypothetical protein [Sphingobium sp.]MCI1755616.1 hypothetical protein [Sphingobium sp.]MCI2052996.1 hypothetical protein [Sphingobium sp.]